MRMRIEPFGLEMYFIGWVLLVSQHHNETADIMIHEDFSFLFLSAVSQHIHQARIFHLFPLILPYPSFITSSVTQI